MGDITVTEVKERLDNGEELVIFDVREPYEYENDHIKAENMPLATIPARIPELESLKDKEIILCCRSGGRSGQATFFLKQRGFTGVRNLVGGMLAWKENIDPDFNVE